MRTPGEDLTDQDAVEFASGEMIQGEKLQLFIEILSRWDKCTVELVGQRILICGNKQGRDMAVEFRESPPKHNS